jgi:hypothetical protein
VPVRVDRASVPESSFSRISVASGGTVNTQDCNAHLMAQLKPISNYEHSFANGDFAVALAVSTT